MWGIESGSHEPALEKWIHTLEQAKKMIAWVEEWIQSQPQGRIELGWGASDNFNTIRVSMSETLADQWWFKATKIIHFSKTTLTSDPEKTHEKPSGDLTVSNGFTIQQWSIAWSKLMGKFYYYQETVYTPLTDHRASRSIERYDGSSMFSPVEIPPEEAMRILADIKGGAEYAMSTQQRHRWVEEVGHWQDIAQEISRVR